MAGLLIISCYFGENCGNIHEAPLEGCSYFFTNNQNLKDDIISKKWNYVFVNKTLSRDPVISSVQAKYIKFLKFLGDYPEFKKYRHILYFDHKLNVTHKTLRLLRAMTRISPQSSLFIPKMNRNEDSLCDEIRLASLQPRYKKNMNKTLEFIKKMYFSRKLHLPLKTSLTGLLLYTNREKIKPLLDNVYHKCVEHMQPECQIYWCIYSYFFRNQITQFNLHDVIV